MLSMKPSLILLLLLLCGPCWAQSTTGFTTSAFPDTIAFRLVKTAPVVLLARPLHSEMFYDESTQKAYIATAVQVLHVLRGESVKSGTLEITQNVSSPHTGVGPKHDFGHRKYTYNQDVFMYFCEPSRLPVNPNPFETTNQQRLSLALAGPGLSPTIHFLSSGSGEPTRIYGLGREFDSPTALYHHLTALTKLSLPDPKFSKYQKSYTFADGREDWIGVSSSPSSSLDDLLTPEEIIQARNEIVKSPYIFTGMVLSSTRFEDAEGAAFISEIVQPVWVFRAGGVPPKGLVEVVETEENYAKGLRQNVPVVYFATDTQLPANPATKSQVPTAPLRAFNGDIQAKIMIGKAGTVLGYNGLYQTFSSPQESWQFINQLPDVSPWLPATAAKTPATTVTSAAAPKE